MESIDGRDDISNFVMQIARVTLALVSIQHCTRPAQQIIATA
jgi:hypothetical protein